MLSKSTFLRIESFIIVMLSFIYGLVIQNKHGQSDNEWDLAEKICKFEKYWVEYVGLNMCDPCNCSNPRSPLQNPICGILL